MHILLVPPEILAQRAEIHHWSVCVIIDNDIESMEDFGVIGTADYAMHLAMKHYRRGKQCDIIMRAMDTDPIVQ